VGHPDQRSGGLVRLHDLAVGRDEQVGVGARGEEAKRVGLGPRLGDGVRRRELQAAERHQRRDAERREHHDSRLGPEHTERREAREAGQESRDQCEDEVGSELHDHGRHGVLGSEDRQGERQGCRGGLDSVGERPRVQARGPASATLGRGPVGARRAAGERRSVCAGRR
jgi:hypothetical protein